VRILISHEPAPRPRIVITQIASSDPEALIAPGDVTISIGESVAVLAELRAPDDSLIPLTAAFRMPVIARDGRERIVLARFENGLAEISTTFAESGVWQIRAAAINSALPVEQHMDFDGLDIYVVQ
jgi:hypothetical protein